MQPLVQLITAWQQYTEQVPNARVEGFCYHYLSANKGQASNNNQADLQLAKQLGKTNSILKTYYKLALRQIPGFELEWYYLLEAIAAGHELRKTEIVSFNLLLEPTTGIDILNRMLKVGIISERVDPADKRVRLIKLTNEGIDLLNHLNALLDKVTWMVLAQVDTDDKVVITRALSGIVDKHTAMFHEGKTKAIENMELAIKQLIDKG
ncbi:MarR family winged helix-turn-helix transcriptional regulator [Mucilaginibacter lappiensis]|uniref:DNA-binding MarR family transcriptional regulator n=1 Tax=Mucilaginibacter lappiensis TaxID=354630 RepID=A0A1N6VJB3_9SPHI|nr:MarR family transcriptional regulator [Mucilaginibacter lappiensis]MBB6109157.1 DNA-binding MarR family transcriptional regulator [Mucilaginibacter lappiensis]MBB6127250.1 DNA-binding MarR family transcriptional regulator [Mucilaginibacter lappiensis]SIQ77915.1 DNA-binding transcriptional regulator, MarR family [Mucilaginibacter lappiensis]